jgi:two-component system response regulator RegX3
MSKLNGVANRGEPGGSGLLSPSQTTELARALASELDRLRPIVACERQDEGCIIIGPLVVDLDGHEVVVDDSIIALHCREFALLRALAQNAGRVLSRDKLIELAWPDPDRVNSSRTVDVHIRRLRFKLGEAAHLIRTVAGAGYKLARLGAAHRQRT